MGDLNSLQIIGDAVSRSCATEMCMANSSFHTTFQMPSRDEERWKVLRTTGKKEEVFSNKVWEWLES